MTTKEFQLVQDLRDSGSLLRQIGDGRIVGVARLDRTPVVTADYDEGEARASFGFIAGAWQFMSGRPAAQTWNQA